MASNTHLLTFQKGLETFRAGGVLSCSNPEGARIYNKCGLHIDLYSTGEILALRRYHKYWIGEDRQMKNPMVGDFERRVLDLKEMRAKAIRYFFEEIDPWVRQGVSICVVPSSDPAVKCSVIGTVGKMLARNGRVDRVGFLIRYIKIKKLSSGGNRRREVHYDSIRSSDEYSVLGEDVLLLDDITTSGNSLFACRDILLSNGARAVGMLALGRTGEGGINLLELGNYHGVKVL